MRFMIKHKKNAICCYPNYGPIFGGTYHDIAINNNCSNDNSCYIGDLSRLQYEYHPQYKSSLFVNTSKSDKQNRFTVLDYEVYAIDYENKEYIYNICKYPDIIWNYIETKDISEESLKQINNVEDINNDLDTINCNNIAIRLKISQYFFKNPSEFLPNTQIVDIQYDSYLRQWLGNDKYMKLIYRASEHDYTASSFHEYCDDNGSTLIIIKSTGGWIFGGYTSKDWNSNSIYRLNNYNE